MARKKAQNGETSASKSGLEGARDSQVAESQATPGSILADIDSAHEQEQIRAEAAEAESVKYMLVRIYETTFAIAADAVREIIGNVPVFFVPFTPPYVRGFINRHGEPYTVLDLRVLFDRAPLESSTFLILKRRNDQLCLLISDVLEIVRRKADELHSITSKTVDDNYFIASLTADGEDGEEIFILDLESILEKLETDIRGI